MLVNSYCVSGIAFHTIDNGNGFSVTLSELGASIFSIEYKGLPMAVAEAQESDFLKSRQYYGRTVGRFAGRIRRGDVHYENVHFRAEANEGKTTLHGGPRNFSFRLFQSELISEEGRRGVLFRIGSPDGDNGFPGYLELAVKYLVHNKEPRLDIVYLYKSDKDTVVNITNHTFFNLGGEEDILAHRLMIPAKQVMDYNEILIPMGYRPLTKALDFTRPKTVGEDIDDPSLYTTNTKGYDHSYFIGEHDYETPIAVLGSSKATLAVHSDYPSLQVYSDNHLDPNLELNIGKGRLHGGLAIEPSHPPLAYEYSFVSKNVLTKRRISLRFN